MAESYGKIHYTPYLCEAVKNFFYEKDWYELNKPKQKHHVRTGYEAELNRIEGAKSHANLQIESGVSEVFENLLNTKINIRKRKRIMDVCRDWQYFSNEEEVFKQCYIKPIL